MLEERRGEMAADIQFVSAFAAFEIQLKALCVKEFPCGLGAWREPDKQTFSPQKKFLPSITGRVPPKMVPAKQQTDSDPQKEPADALQDFVKSKFSPWHLDYTWSNEAEELRAIAVKSPWLVDKKFVLHHFRTLKILDRGVTDVDERLLKLQNLEELILTANFIQTVDARHLPRSLKVLELCANNISDISMFCNYPPLLVHLGLGYNSISFIGDYITGDIWPELLSLDLSYNNLTDLLDFVRKLSTLPKLRNLVLQGNPFCLIPGYRGYIIDSLRILSILDDIMISADEKHHFKGLARRKEYILDEAIVTLEVPRLKGLPMPKEIKDPTLSPEFPVIERLYFVQFMYLADHGGQAKILHIVPDDPEDIQDEMRSVEAAGSPISLIREEGGSKQTKDAGAGGLGICLAPVNSCAKPWAEEIEMDWQTDLVRDDLAALRDFFKQGLQVSVVEQVVLCHLVEPASDTGLPGAKNKKPDSPKNSPKNSPKTDKKKKPKEISEKDLRRDPPQLTTLASFHIPLASFLEGEFQVSSVFTKQMVSPDSASKISGSEESSKGTKSSKDKKKDPESAKEKGKGDKKGKDAKGKKKDDQSSPGSYDSQSPPLLELQVAVRLHHWTTATDSLKEEEGKT